MAYEKTTWQSGDVVTSEKLNNIENGIASRDALICEAVVDEQAFTVTLDKTAREVREAYLNGRQVILHMENVIEDAGLGTTVTLDTHSILVTIDQSNEYGYGVSFLSTWSDFTTVTFYAQNLDDYLVN